MNPIFSAGIPTKLARINLFRSVVCSVFLTICCQVGFVYGDTAIDDYALSYLGDGMDAQSLSCDRYKFRLKLNNTERYSEIKLYSTPKNKGDKKYWLLKKKTSDEKTIFTHCLDTGNQHQLWVTATGGWYTHKSWKWQYYNLPYSLFDRHFKFQIPFYWYSNTKKKYPDINQLVETVDVPKYRHRLNDKSKPKVSINQIQLQPNNLKVTIDFKEAVYTQARLYINGINVHRSKPNKQWTIHSDTSTNGRRTINISFHRNGDYTLMAKAIGKAGRKYVYGNRQYDTYKYHNNNSMPKHVSIGDLHKSYWLSNIDQDHKLELLHYHLSDSTLFLNREINLEAEDFSIDLLTDLLHRPEKSIASVAVAKALIQFGPKYHSRHADISIHDVMGANNHSPDDITFVFPELCEGFIYSNNSLKQAINTGRLPLNELDADIHLNLCNPDLVNYTEASIVPHELYGDNKSADEASAKTIVLYSDTAFKALDLISTTELSNDADTLFRGRVVDGVKNSIDDCNTDVFFETCSILQNDESILYIQPYKQGHELGLLISTTDQHNKAKFYNYKKGPLGYQLELRDPDYVVEIKQNGQFNQYAYAADMKIINTKPSKIGQCQNFVLLESDNKQILFAIKDGCLALQPHDFDANAEPEIYLNSPITPFDKPLHLHWNSVLSNFSRSIY